MPKGEGNLFVKIFTKHLTYVFIYGIITTVRQYKINVLYIYSVLRLVERRENMSGYKQWKGLLGSMHLMWKDLSHKGTNTH